MDVDYQVMTQDYKKELLQILYLKSFKFDSEKGFTLSSGAKSDLYIDAKKTVYCSQAMELLGYAFFQEIKHEPVDAVGGLTLGADPIAYATAMVSTMNGKYIDAFVVRKEPKQHGTQQWIEGDLKEGAWVIILDDVVTTGASTIKAIERAREAGLQVRKAFALVDREEGAKQNIESQGKVKFDSIFTRTDLLEMHEKVSKMKKEDF